jgi:hypothetical protein
MACLLKFIYDEFKEKYIEALLFLGRSLGSGMATIGMGGAGVGIGVVFGSLLFH